MNQRPAKTYPTDRAMVGKADSTQYAVHGLWTALASSKQVTNGNVLTLRVEDGKALADLGPHVLVELLGAHGGEELFLAHVRLAAGDFEEVLLRRVGARGAHALLDRRVAKRRTVAGDGEQSRSRRAIGIRGQGVALRGDRTYGAEVLGEDLPRRLLVELEGLEAQGTVCCGKALHSTTKTSTTKTRGGGRGGRIHTGKKR